MSVKRILQRDLVMNVVEEVVGANGKPVRYICRASSEEGHSCTYAQISFVAGNFKRHLLSCHGDLARELGFAPKDEPRLKKQRDSKLSVDICRREVLLGTLELSTGHNMPLRFPEWRGIKTLLVPLWKAAGFNITREKLSKLIKNAAGVLRLKIQEELRTKIVCLKIDSASRKGRSVFGINLQYIDEDGNIRIRHLGENLLP